MRVTLTIPSGISRSLPLVLALVALFLWTSVAQAQSLEAASYDNPAESVAAADTSAGGGDAGSGVQGVSLLPADNAASANGSGSASGGGSAGGGTLGISLLPSTGGPLLPLVGLGAVALGATGLLARHRYSRR